MNNLMDDDNMINGQSASMIKDVIEIDNDNDANSNLSRNELKEQISKKHAMQNDWQRKTENN